LEIPNTYHIQILCLWAGTSVAAKEDRKEKDAVPDKTSAAEVAAVEH